MKKKYILICSDENEGSTDLVCDWLNHFKKPFIRISSNDLIRIENIKIFNNDIDIEFKVKNIKLMLSDIKSYWYRRSNLSFEAIHKVEKEIDNDDISYGINLNLISEYNKVVEFFEESLNNKAKLNTYKNISLNKLNVLSIASKLGIKIPDTLVCNKKIDLNLFKHKDLITKAIGDFMFTKEDTSYSIMTNKISNQQIESDVFFHTLFQNQIDKDFELRIFFMKNKFYSSAIFSQINEKTKVDFRNYDIENPNRVVPFKLHPEIENKLLKLMKKLNLKSGSIDMAYTKNDEYIFFEVNPIGQFEQVTFPCNFNLHREIALEL